MSIGPYYVGDNPATPITLDLVSEEDFDGYLSATITLTDPEGKPVQNIGPVVVDQEQITFTIPSGSFQTAGLYHLDVRLVGDGTVTLPPQPIVVQGSDGWHTLDSARAEWHQAPDTDVTLWTVLETARIDCEAYAPKLNGRPVPVNYRAAQLAQARNTLNAGRVNPAGEYGQESFSLSPFPLDWKVKALLRPKRGVPVVS